MCDIKTYLLDYSEAIGRSLMDSHPCHLLLAVTAPGFVVFCSQ